MLLPVHRLQEDGIGCCGPSGTWLKGAGASVKHGELTSDRGTVRDGRVERYSHAEAKRTSQKRDIQPGSIVLVLTEYTRIRQCHIDTF